MARVRMNGVKRIRKKDGMVVKYGGKEWFEERDFDGKLLSVSGFDECRRMDGVCYEYESGKVMNECVYEHGVKKRVIREFSDDKMRVFDENGNRVYEGVCEGMWFGDIVNGIDLYPSLQGMKRWVVERNEKGELLSMSEYDNEQQVKEGNCYEFEGGRVVRKCVYKKNELIRVLREWKGDVMIEYDDNGKRVYEGGWKGDMKRGFAREGKGTEYENDGKKALYIGEWKGGLREGYGSEFKGGSAVYIGEWKDGMKDGMGKEYNDNGDVVRRGRWTSGEYGTIRRFDNGYGKYFSVFDISYLEGVTRLVIGDDCFKNVNEFVIDGLNELESVKIGWDSFSLSWDTREGSKCLIMNCDRLREVEIGGWSFLWYEVLELKNLPSLHSIQMGYDAFGKCHSIVFESDNDE